VALRLDQLLLGSIRTIRDHNHARTLASSGAAIRAPADRLARSVDAASRCIEQLPAAQREQVKALGLTPALLRERGQVVLEALQPALPVRLAARMTSLDGKHRLELHLTAEQGRWQQQQRLLTAPELPFTIEVELLTSYPSVPILPVEQLLRPEALALLRRHGVAPHGKTLRSLRFLATRDRYLAGSWRFLTYFGRDTLMTLWLMLPLLRPAAVEIGLQSVLDRLSSDGRVAHEESLGDQASVERLERFVELAGLGRHDAALEQLRRLGRPVHDYTMVDDDLMLPCVLAAYLDEAVVTAGRARRLLGRGDNRRRLARNLTHVIQRLADGRISLLSGSTVGDWRDSQEGLGGGRFPASVNLSLAPMARGAALRLLEHPKLDGQLLRAVREQGTSKEQIEALQRPGPCAAGPFRVQLSVDQLRRRLRRFLARAACSELERRLLRQREVADGLTLEQLLEGDRVPPALQAGLSFDALALDGKGRPVQVMHSDDSFRLLGAPADTDWLARHLLKYELAYPLGLYDPHGVFVANPALSDRTADYDTFDRGHYHGTVVWSWQLGMLQLGLVRQYRHLRSKGPKALAGRVRALLVKLRQINRRVGSLQDSELWSVVPTDEGFQPAAYGHGSGETTESNALQLWSVVHLAVVQAYAAAGIER